MFHAFRQILALLDRKERRQFFWLIGMTIVMGLFDMLGVASIMPFLAVVSNPESIETNWFLSLLYDWSGATDARGFMFQLGVLVFVFVLFTTAFRAATFYALTLFTKMRTLTLAVRLMQRYLGQPYVWFLNQHTSKLGKSILSEVNEVVNGSLTAAMQLIANSVMITFLVILLLIVEPMAAIGAAVLFGGSYGLIYLIARARLGRLGEERFEVIGQKFKIMQEAMGGIKYVKLRSLERDYIARFREPALRLARNQSSIAVLSQLPRHLLEVISFGGMILFVLWLLATRESDMSNVIPIIGVFALAAARMFPTIQQLFASFSMLRYGRMALDHLHGDLTGPVGGDFARASDLPAIPLRRELVLENIRFTFPEAEAPALDGLSLTIPAQTTVGIVGTTGAGKTTAIDLILGLLAAQSGHLKVDGQIVDETNVRAWQKSVGYVPQDIFLVDDTIAANIAFGAAPGEIDHDAVMRAAKVAELHDFVMDRLPQGYETLVGERGTRLSGGQRQRIGIARAVYTNPDILIFDEATSALDNLTEKAVMDAVRRLGKSKTVVLVAHRLSTVRKCDTIFLLEEGRLVGSGTYAQLIEKNARFRALHEAMA